MAHSTTLGDLGTIYRGSPWKLAVPKTVTVDGSEIDYTSTGSLQVQYRTQGATGAATRWGSGDGSSRFEVGSGDFNYFLIPSDDALMGTEGDGTATYDVEADYIDTSAEEHPVGINGVLTVKDRTTGAPD